MSEITKMVRTLSKKDLLRHLEKLDVMEIVIQAVDRSDSNSKKLSKLSEFQRAAKAQIDDERDVLLISVKVK